MKKLWILSYPLSAQRRLWSDWADAQADLSLRRAHTHFVGFVISRLIYRRINWHSCFGFAGIQQGVEQNDSFLKAQLFPETGNNEGRCSLPYNTLVVTSQTGICFGRIWWSSELIFIWIWTPLPFFSMNSITIFKHKAKKIGNKWWKNMVLKWRRKVYLPSEYTSIM